MSNEEIRIGFLEHLSAMISLFVIMSPILGFIIVHFVLEWTLFQAYSFVVIQLILGLVLLVWIVVPYMNKLKLIPSVEEIQTYSTSDWIWSFIKNLGFLFGCVILLSPPVTLLYSVRVLEMNFGEAMGWFWIHVFGSIVVGSWLFLRFRRRIRESSDISIVGS